MVLYPELSGLYFSSKPETEWAVIESSPTRLGSAALFPLLQESLIFLLARVGSDKLIIQKIADNKKSKVLSEIKKIRLTILNIFLYTDKEEESPMTKFPGFIAKHKLFLFFLFLLLIIVVVLPLLSLISINFIHSLNLPVQQVNHWINQHHSLFLCWHLLLLVAIYFGWGFKVEKEAKQKELTAEQIKKAKRFRWLIIGSVIIIDLLAHI